MEEYNRGIRIYSFISAPALILGSYIAVTEDAVMGWRLLMLALTSVSLTFFLLSMAFYYKL